MSLDSPVYPLPRSRESWVGTERVSPERSQRVYEAVQQLNYQPDRVARRLRAPGRQLWALVVSDIENPFFTSLARGVEDAAHESGAVVILCNSDLDPEREKRYFEIAVTERVGGVVLAPSSPRVDISVLQQAKVPVVVVNQPLAHATVETITSDNTTGGELAAEEFLAHGYRRIAAIVGQTTAPGLEQPPDRPAGTTRCPGWRGRRGQVHEQPHRRRR